jgi:DNA-binding Lrp family transcriptional regulator
MNKKDFQILAHLRQDARMPLAKMSRQTHIPISTLFDRMKAQEGSVIVKHTSLLNFAAMGYNTRANIAFRVCREDKEALKEYLMKHESVNSFYRINNGYDFMVEGIFQQIREMEDFIDQVENRFKIEEKQSFYIIEDMKKESFLADPSLLPA